MLIVDERISIPRCTLTAPKSCEKAIGNVDTRPLPPVFPHCSVQWINVTINPGRNPCSLPISFSTNLTSFLTRYADNVDVGGSIAAVYPGSQTVHVVVDGNTASTWNVIVICK